MLNFKSTAFVYVISIVALIPFLLTTREAIWLLLFITVLFIGSLVYGSVFVCSGYYIKTTCKAETDKKVVSLTFDDGPHEKVTLQVLEILQQHQIRATFFCIGSNVLKNKTLVKKMNDEGHLLANHSFGHAFFFDLKNSRGMKHELVKAEDAIFSVTGRRTAWFRPPYGVTNPALAKAAKSLGYDVIGWTARGMDTASADAEKITKRIISQLNPGAIILLHDTREQSVEALGKIIEYCVNRGFQFVRLDELVGKNPYKN